MADPLPLLHLHHLARVTHDVAASVDFYCRVLGFRELPRPPFNFTGAWLYGYGIQIHIIENQNLGLEGQCEVNTRGNHVAFATNDGAAVRARLASEQIECKEQVNAGGAKQIFFRDPDGHQIEIAEYPNPDPAVGYQGE